MLVSVIIPTFNRFKELCRAIDSVLDQTYKEIEIIVVNDCSTDEEYKNLENKYKDKIILINLPINQRILYKSKHAQGMTRNHGLKIAKGEWIAFLDDDDWFYPNKIEKQLQILKENPQYLMCATNMTIYNTKTQEKTERYLRFNKKLREPNKIKENLFVIDKKRLYETNLCSNSTMIFHRSIYEKVGDQNICIYEDYDYWKRCIEYSNCILLMEDLVYYSMQNTKNYE